MKNYVENQFLTISPDNGKLTVRNRRLGRTINLSWPAVTLSLNGRALRPTQALTPPVFTAHGFSQKFQVGGVRFEVAVTLAADRPWFNKKVVMTADADQPTPDFVEVDRQTPPPDRLSVRGYLPTTPLPPRTQGEEGSGIMPGCGYPLIGKHFFVGLEHAAAFNRLETVKGRQIFYLRHHPVWRERRIESEAAVFGWAEDAEQSFNEYLDAIRLPPLKDPFVCFCTFWSDPYIGNYEYAVSLRAYQTFFQVFFEHGLIPDAFTLDAGWNERRSVFAAKREVGGDRGLIKLRKLAETHGSALSIWVSHNGPMGMATEYMKESGFATGGGNSATYSGSGYGVMMDEKLVSTLSRRFGELVTRIGAKHLKMDWDNDCAVNDEFKKIYPTVDHVREAGLNAFFRIGRELRAKNSRVLLRNGWCPSPWWLREGNHVFLPDSGDSEYTAMPSRTQRDAAATHRDLMYFNVLRRDRSALPLECFDNHEFGDAARNPFADSRRSWVDAIWWSFLRGSSYLTYTFQPETLEDWQTESLRRIMEFCRVHAKKIFVAHGQMILGHPGRGEIYGFIQPGSGETWCALRNPSPCPQILDTDLAALVAHPVAGALQIYPHFEAVKPGDPLTFLAHEVKLIILAGKKIKPEFKPPFIVEKTGQSWLYRFPGDLEINESIRPLCDPVQRIKSMACLEFESRSAGAQRRDFDWFLRVPYRVRNCEFQGKISGVNTEKLKLRAFSSRYPKGSSARYALPITIVPAGIPGYGEQKNADVTCATDTLYFAIVVPSGGEFDLALSIGGADLRKAKFEFWLSGYQAPSRAGLRRRRAPAGFEKAAPYPHPLGFPRALALPCE